MGFDSSEAAKEAFRQLVVEHYDRIFEYARWALGNEDDAKDIAQDVFTRAYKTRDTLLAHEKPGGWLVNTMKNVIHEHKRALKKQASIVHESITRHGSLMVSFIDIDDELDKGILDELKPKERELIIMAYIAEQPYPRIADMLGTSETNARKRVSRARMTYEENVRERNLLK